MLKQRIITAALLVPIVVGLVLYIQPIAFLIVTAIITLMAAMEYMTLMRLQTVWARILYLVIIVNLMVGLLFVPTPLELAVGFVWWLIACVIVALYPRGASSWSSNKVITGLIGILVLMPCWVALNYIRNTPNGTILLLYVLVLIWGADTSAYFAGKRWGKTKLAPAVSPGKTVQGAIAALVFALVFSAIAGAISNPPAVILLSLMGLSVWTVIFSIVGDLFESVLKREAGFKDSGNLLPGHGGLLDRIDSLTAAAPVYAFTSILLSWFFTS